VAELQARPHLALTEPASNGMASWRVRPMRFLQRADWFVLSAARFGSAAGSRHGPAHRDPDA